MDVALTWHDAKFDSPKREEDLHRNDSQEVCLDTAGGLNAVRVEDVAVLLR